MLSVELIRETLQNALAGGASFEEFEDWLVGASWNMHQNADLEAQRLAGAIEHRFAEYSSGCLDDTTLREELLALFVYGCPTPALEMPVFSTGFLPSVIAVSSSSPDPDPAAVQYVRIGQQVPCGPRSTGSSGGRTITARQPLELTVA